MSARYHNNVDQVIMVQSDDEDKVGHRERPPLYTTLPRSGEIKHNTVDSTEPTTLMRTARQERTEKRRLKRIFRAFDENDDGFLEKREVKRLITSNPDEFVDVSRALSKATLTMKATSKMSFLQFLNLIEDHEDFEVNDFVEQISRAIIAPRDDSGFDTKPKGFTFYVPIMVIFSILQIICYMHDYIQSNGDKNIINEEGNKHFDGNLDFMNGNWAKQLKVGIHTNGVYRYITYQFVHADNFHLIGNILIQLLLGIPLEFMHGSWRLIVVYLAGVLSGSIGHVNFETSNLGGASGGVYAMITAHIASVLMNWKAMRFAFIHLLAFLGFIVKNGYSGYKDQQTENEVKPDEKGSRVGNIAHLGGAIAGLLVGIGMLRNFNSSRSKRSFWVFCVAVYCTIMIIGMLSIHCKQNSSTDATHFCNTYQNDINDVVNVIKNFTSNSINEVKSTFVKEQNITFNADCTNIDNPSFECKTKLPKV